MTGIVIESLVAQQRLEAVDLEHSGHPEGVRDIAHRRLIARITVRVLHLYLHVGHHLGPDLMPWHVPEAAHRSRIHMSVAQHHRPIVGVLHIHRRLSPVHRLDAILLRADQRHVLQLGNVVLWQQVTVQHIRCNIPATARVQVVVHHPSAALGQIVRVQAVLVTLVAGERLVAHHSHSPPETHATVLGDYASLLSCSEFVVLVRKYRCGGWVVVVVVTASLTIRWMMLSRASVLSLLQLLLLKVPRTV